MKDFISKGRITIFAMLVMAMSQPSCSNFLDVVPDNVFQYEDLFTSQEQAYNALANLSVMLPADNRMTSSWALGDEYSTVTPYLETSNDIHAYWIMMGRQSATNSLMNFWTGRNLRAPWNMGMYVQLRYCDLFIRNVDLIPDMTVEMKAEWKAQAKFLKAFYLFSLVQMYGPVIIPEFFDDRGAISTELHQTRSKVEDCFDYILALIDESIPYLKGRRDVLWLGQPDQVTAKAIKARVLLTRASPFYNGNADFYHNFRDHNDEHFFAQTADRDKWKAAADAAQVALDACAQYGFRLYHFKGIPYDYDVEDFGMNPERMQTLYDLRFRITERWNEEIIWGWSRSGETWAGATIIELPDSYGWNRPSIHSGGWACASYQAMERYYTQNGLPLDEDRTVDMNALHEFVTTPEETDPKYTSMRGFMQHGETTINMYLNREPRFYTDLGITGGYFRAYGYRINTVMFKETPGGFIQARHTIFAPSSGIAIQKVGHPEAYYSSNNYRQTLMVAPNPIMRVADLYLMKAEALNEYYGPSQEVYDAVNEVRLRAGIPTVEESYGDDSPWVTDQARNKHLTKEGMRDIILRERANEFAFEYGHRFWDMQRWKRSVSEFSRPLYGWNVLGTNEISFFVLRILQGRKWGITEYLWPIDKTEMERNANLIQNPGW